MASLSRKSLAESNPWWAKAVELLSSLENAELESKGKHQVAISVEFILGL